MIGNGWFAIEKVTTTLLGNLISAFTTTIHHFDIQDQRELQGYIKYIYELQEFIMVALYLRNVASIQGSQGRQGTYPLIHSLIVAIKDY